MKTLKIIALAVLFLFETGCSGGFSSLSSVVKSAGHASLSSLSRSKAGSHAVTLTQMGNNSNMIKVVDAQQGGFGYAYAPAIIYTQGEYHAYFCSEGNGTNADWDDIRHVSSADLVNWSAPSELLIPTAKERSNCDPSVVYFNAGDGAYYYLFYGGNVQNVQTVTYVARSTSPAGPFLKYTDRGTWESAPSDPHVIVAPFQSSPDTAGMYGAGQPSVVVQNGMLYMWYTDTTETATYSSGTWWGERDRIYLKTSLDAVNWSAPVRVIEDEATIDVKFDSTSGLFVMAETDGSPSTLAIRTSLDGINWGGAQVICDASCMPNFAGNVGMSGDDQGNLIANNQVLVGWGSPYNLHATADTWGQWDLWGAFFDLSLSAPIPTVAKAAPPVPPAAATQFALARVPASVPAAAPAPLQGGAAAVIDPAPAAAPAVAPAVAPVVAPVVAPTVAPAPASPTLIPIYRLYNPIGDHLYSTNSNEAVSGGYGLDGVAFSLATSSGSDLQALYRCRNGLDHFLSTDANCEGYTTESALGYLHQSAVGNPLYRFYNQHSAYHLETTNPAEGYNSGFILEAVIGYVW